MSLPIVFKLSIYTLTAFVGLALGAAERGFIPFVSLPVAIFAYWWCEVPKPGRERRGGLVESTAVGIGALAFVAAAIEFFGINIEGRLLSGIHLVVYLTWIVLLQQKSVYRYWLLMTLGMMQVAVGSVLTNANWYGLCLVIYLFGAIWTLSVFSLYRVAEEFKVTDPLDRGHVRDSSSSDTAAVFNAVRFEDHARWISMRLINGVAFMSMAGLFVGALFFLLIPRIWVGSALGITDESLPAAMRRTGQATQVNLGDMGAILESNDPVLTLKIYDHQTNKQVSAETYARWLGLREPLFRGAVLTDYSEGTWRPERNWTTTPDRLTSDPPKNVHLLRQEYHLERIGAEALYCMGRPLAMRDPEGFRCGLILPNTLVIRRDWFQRLPGPVDYIAFSELPSSEAKQDVGLIATAKEMVVTRVSHYARRCSEIPEGMNRLREKSDQVVEAKQKEAGRPLTDVEKAQAIEYFLRDSGEFAYSLNSQVVDPDMDPVEDFLFNRRAGHCQYFASTLALMFRSVGIPTRLVTGFKGGEELPDGTLNVEKRYAHVWVEAWIDNRKWMTFDATPEDGRAESIDAIGTKRNFWTSIQSRLSGMWDANILDMSLERQEDSFYTPLRDAFTGVADFGREFVKSPVTTVSTHLRAIVAIIWLASLAVLLWLFRRRFMFRLWTRPFHDPEEAQRSRVEFYERFVSLMQTCGQVREPAQTQGEFVEQITTTLSTRLRDATLIPNLHSIAELFYLVRFGDGELSPQQQLQLGELLSRLETGLVPAASPDPNA
ncbi:MAG: transglutaminase domain-containing protein [Planctomycetes bacterium]|nr:transglutaminase domain-containing protein [Planctomycetota bacterium]